MYDLPYEWQCMKDEIAIFWNLMGLFAQLAEEVPEYERLIVAIPGRSHWKVMVPCRIDASFRQSISELFQVEEEIVEIKRWSWQWHDSTGVWRILEIDWGYGPKSKTLVYSDPRELPYGMWPMAQYYDKFDRDQEHYRVYRKFREDAWARMFQLNRRNND